MSQLSLFEPTQPWTVSRLTRYLRELLEGDAALQDVWVQGELSNLSRPASGHIYFTLKDAGGALRGVMWRAQAVRQPFLPRDGQQVEVHGSLSVYEAGGQYQLYADLFRPAGEGALYAEFLRLKAALENEGLFAAERKRPLPARPRCIGIVTSPSGAALRDILNTLRRRYPLAKVVLAPTPVQGDEAAPGIVRALQALNRTVHPDLIIVARGGGSIEDLWAFNAESVARAIAASAAPVITGVGHETDFTIADFVADMRAPTPTAAAEQAAPHTAELHDELLAALRLLQSSLQSALQTRRWQVERLSGRLQAASPAQQARRGRQRLDELTGQAERGLTHALAMRRAGLAGLSGRLLALSPQAVLQRGYAILTTPGGDVLHSVRQARPGQMLLARLSDGLLPVQVRPPMPTDPPASRPGPPESFDL